MKWEYGTDSRNSSWGGKGELDSFLNAPLKNLVREVIQNSLDNPKTRDFELPVNIEFTEKKIQTSDFPGIEEHLTYLREGLRTGKNHKRLKTDMNEAINKLKNKELSVLMIRDWNTTGLIHEKGNEDCGWWKYTRTMGVSDGEGLGNHGHGKMAPFAASLVRYLFIISDFYDAKTDELVQRSQGFSFISGRENREHGREINRYFSNYGYFGDDDLKPLLIAPKELQWALKETPEEGTTLLLPCWKSHPGWEKTFLAHSMINYFAAIERENLVVKIKGNNQSNCFELNKETLPEFFEKHKGILMNHMDSVEDGKGGSDFEKASFYYKCLKEGKNVKIHTIPKVAKFGDVKIRFLDTKGMESKKDTFKNVGVIRRNMFITDQLEKFKQFTPGFLALLELEEKESLHKGEKYLAMYENASHTALTHEKFAFEHQKEAKDCLDKLCAKIRELFRDLTQEENEELPERLTILDKFFRNIGNVQSTENENDETDPDGDFIFEPIKRKKLNEIISRGSGTELVGVDTETIRRRETKKRKKRGVNPPGPGDIISKSQDAPNSFNPEVKINKFKIVRSEISRIELLVNVSQSGKFTIKIEEIGATQSEIIHEQKFILQENVEQNLEIMLPQGVLGALRPFIEIVEGGSDEI